MRKFNLLVLFLVFISLTANAQEISSSIVCPGVKHHTYYFDDQPWTINLLEVDLANSNVDIETIKARDLVAGYETTRQMSARRSFNKHWIAGVVNGDFYQKGGTPINTQVIEGKILKSPNNRSLFGIYYDKTPFIAVPSYSGKIVLTKGNTYAIQGINQNRDSNQLVLYNSFFGDSTGTNRYGAEISFRLLDAWAVNEPFRVIVSEIDSVKGNGEIKVNGGLLSGHGWARVWLLMEMSLGDTLKLILKLTKSDKKIKEAIGGLPRIIRDGLTSIEKGGRFADVRHPRTGIGFSEDGSKLFLFTVDGRQENYSKGMTLYEMADFMRSIGVYQGINLDGGGSTTMVVANRIVNRPSDATGERPVANALLVISKEPLIIRDNQNR